MVEYDKVRRFMNKWHSILILRDWVGAAGLGAYWLHFSAEILPFALANILTKAFAILWKRRVMTTWDL